MCHERSSTELIQAFNLSALSRSFPFKTHSARWFEQWTSKVIPVNPPGQFSFTFGYQMHDNLPQIAKGTR
jgi:ribosome biogenesis protein Nip4